MQGSRFCSATSCARVCLRAVIGKYDPPFTVASLQMIITSRPSTRPIPVMIPAPPAPDPGDDPGPGGLVVVHPVRRQWRQLEERGSAIEQPAHAVAGEQLPAPR